MEHVRLYASAARNAVLGARFDDVGIHAANGCLLEKLLLMNSNRRTGFCGGSVENCALFVFQVIVDA
jgi:NADPH2 dehydrogenase